MNLPYRRKMVSQRFAAVRLGAFACLVAILTHCTSPRPRGTTSRMTSSPLDAGVRRTPRPTVNGVPHDADAARSASDAAAHGDVSDAASATPIHAAYSGQLGAGDRMAVSSHRPDALQVFDRSGSELWRSTLPLKHPQQLSALAGGRLLCATIKGAHLLRPNGTSLWFYEVPAGSENATAVSLAQQRYLVAHEGESKLVELDGTGKPIASTPVQPRNSRVHGQFRYVGYDPQADTLLLPMTNSATFREVQRGSGKVVWEIADLASVTSALRRPDGGTYIAYRDTLASYDAQRELEWTLSLQHDLGLLEKVPPVSMVRLAEGHLLVALWHRHSSVPDVIEVDPVARRLVHQWHLPGVEQAAGLAVLPAAHRFASQR